MNYLKFTYKSKNILPNFIKYIFIYQKPPPSSKEVHIQHMSKQHLTKYKDGNFELSI